MTDETATEQTNEEQQFPILSIQKIYTRDVSFENPNAPEFFMTGSDPNIELNLGGNNRQVDDDHWEVTLKVTVLARDKKTEKIVFEVEVEQAGVFLIKNVPDEHMPAVLGIDCPTILFPYLRQVVGQATTDGGYVPLMLDPFNFAAAYQQGQSPVN